MYTFAIVLLLVAFQVSCDAAPRGLIPEPTTHADVSQGKPADVPQEKSVDVSQEKPVDVPQEKPVDVSQEKPADVPQQKPADVSLEKYLEKRAGR